MPQNAYPMIAQRLIGVPLLLQPQKARVIVDALSDRVNAVLIDGDNHPTPDARFVEQQERRAAGYSLQRGVGVIEVMDSLVARSGWLGRSSGLTSYCHLQRGIELAGEDDDAHTVLFDISSFGGEAELCMETGEAIAALAREKHVVAIAHEYAASAAYWLGSQASEFIVTPAAEVGSVGVVVTLVTQVERDKAMGLVIEHIHAGAQKVDFSPHVATTPEAAATMQARVNELYGLFVNAVATGRDMPPEEVRATEARMFSAEDAVKLGLADRIDTYQNLLLTLQTPRASATSARGPQSMTIETTEQLREKYPGLCSELEQGARESAATVERTRMCSILNLPEAEHRSKIAIKLAGNPAFDADSAKEILAEVPETYHGKLDTTDDGDGDADAEGDDPDADAEAEDGDDDDDDGGKPFGKHRSRPGTAFQKTMRKRNARVKPGQSKEQATRKDIAATWAADATELYGDEGAQ